MAEKRRATTFRTSKGTIVNVQYPDIYVSPAFLSSEDVTSPTELRAELRGVAVSEGMAPLGIHRARDQQGSTFDKKLGRIPLTDVEAAVYGDVDGETIIVGNYYGTEPHYSLVKFDRDYNILWSWSGLYRIMGMDMNFICGKLLVGARRLADNKSLILEVDPANGNILRTLSGTALGSFLTHYLYVRVDLRSVDNSEFWVSDSDGNYVVKTNWAGADLWHVSLADGNEIDYPKGICLVDYADFAAYQALVIVPNAHTNSVVWFQYPSKTVRKRWCYPYPAVCELALLNTYSIFLGSEHPGSLSYIGGGAGNHETVIDFATGMAAIPLRLKSVRRHPKEPQTFLIADGPKLWEFNFSRLYRGCPLPIEQLLWESKAMTLATNYESLPIVDVQVPKKTINVVSSQAGTVLIQVPEGGMRDWTGNWVTYATYALAAGALTPYSTDNPLGVFRLVANLTVTGVVTAWVGLEPVS